MSIFTKIINGDIPSYSIEKRYVRKDKVIVWANMTGSLVRTSNGTPDYAVAIVEDIKPDAEDVLLTKWRYSAFQRTDLHQRMKEMKRDQLIICGTCS